MFNPINQQQVQQMYQMFYMQYAQQQHMIQCLIQQQQCSTNPPVEYKIEQPSYVSPHGYLSLPFQPTPSDKTIDQVKVQTEHDQLTCKQPLLDDEDSQSRVNGHWTRQEHQMYLKFVQDHEDILRSKYDKKSKKIFKLMSQQIPSRTATQCRSHHQKFNPLAKGKKKQRNQIRSIPTIIGIV